MAMAFEHYIRSGQKQLRCGYTTGTCGALAAQGAAYLLLTGTAPDTVSLLTPKGLLVEVALIQPHMSGETAVCGVIKDAGDDIDVTAGLCIYAAVSRRRKPGIVIDGGEGIGRVTKPGLDQPIGAAAINQVPRRMIEQAVQQVLTQLGEAGGLTVILSAPGGVKLAEKTFNPKLGIVGGLSILGTSGIVEPMSVQALIDTTAVELRQAAAQSKRLILTPGNYGMDFIHQQQLDQLGVPIVRCSNFIGDALDSAAAAGFVSVLLVGHAGKLVKLAGGIMNTHSKVADCRTELFCTYAAVCGGTQMLCEKLLDAATADACIALLEEAGLREPVLSRLTDAMERQLLRRTAGAYQMGLIYFSKEYGLLGETETARCQLIEWRNNQ